MNSYLQRVYTHAENTRTELLALVETVDNHVLNQQPSSEKWSTLQILTHLYISEKLSLAYIKKKSLGINNLGNAGIVQSLLMIVLKISQRLPFKFKAPKVVVENTLETMPLEELRERWSLLRLELKALLENLPPAHIHKLVYKHPVAGRLSLPQAIVFFAEHIHHHVPQIKRILKTQN